MLLTSVRGPISSKPVSGQRRPFPTADLKALLLRSDKIFANPNDHHLRARSSGL
jgi:hypothetical protein